ncbi:hypothetical protein X943_001785 [Babesia divergens]|uniref:Uncharacterized protein n=1 Tax=Babesia divergens TaxID=32595 RepID=A0AAD9GD14_BABDI|nr:hypothetical protein X943_001785 [Babesia divergens]
MEGDGEFPGVCSPDGPAIVVAGRSCALVYNGSQSQGVVHAVMLLSTLLNCVDELQDKRGLLICKRESWEEAVANLGCGLTDCFDDCTFPCSRLCGPDACGLDAKESLDLLLRHAFRTEGSDMGSYRNAPGSLSDITEYDLCSQMSNTTLHSACTIPNQGIGIPGSDRYVQICPVPTKDNGDYSTMQQLIAMERRKEDKLDRLLVRFVDEMPLESLEGGVEIPNSAAFNSFVEPGMEMKWNYIQAANEIASHPQDVAVVVIAGMSQMQQQATLGGDYRPSQNSDAHRPPSEVGSTVTLANNTSAHPFDSYLTHKWDEDEEEDDTNLAYRLKHLRSYTFNIQLALNALQANLKLGGTVNESLPKFFLVDRLPSRPADQGKFITFLRSRFQFLYKLE